MSTWTKLPPFAGKIANPCLNCPSHEEVAPLGLVIAVGFGSACVTKDGALVYDEPDIDSDAECWTVAEAEAAALADPDHDWRILLHGPMRGATWQRHGDARWVLVESNEGFA